MEWRRQLKFGNPAEILQLFLQPTCFFHRWMMQSIWKSKVIDFFDLIDYFNYKVEFLMSLIQYVRLG